MPKKSVEKQSGMPGWWGQWGKYVDSIPEPEGYSELIKTGSPTINDALGVGGIPRGCILSVIGKEGSGKTTFAQMLVGNVQEQYPGAVIVYIDAEAKFDRPTAERNGMRIDDALFDSRRLLFITPGLIEGISYERVVQILESLMLPQDGEAPAPNGIFAVIDSMDSLATQTELEMDASDGGAKFGAVAKANSINLRRLAGLVKQTNSNILMLHQLRDKIGAQAFHGVVPTDIAGGHAVKHYAKIQMWLSPNGKKAVGDAMVGYNIDVSIKKNNYHRPFVDTHFMLRYDYDRATNTGGGIDRAQGLIDLGIEQGVIKTSGAFYKVPVALGFPDAETKSFQGMENLRRSISADPGWADELEDFLRGGLTPVSRLNSSAGEEGSNEPE